MPEQKLHENLHLADKDKKEINVCFPQTELTCPASPASCYSVPTSHYSWRGTHSPQCLQSSNCSRLGRDVEFTRKPFFQEVVRKVRAPRKGPVETNTPECRGSEGHRSHPLSDTAGTRQVFMAEQTHPHSLDF